MIVYQNTVTYYVQMFLYDSCACSSSLQPASDHLPHLPYFNASLCSTLDEAGWGAGLPTVALSWSSTQPALRSVSRVCAPSPILRHTPCCSVLPDQTFMAMMSWERLLPHSPHVPIAWSYSTSPCPAICSVCQGSASCTAFLCCSTKNHNCKQCSVIPCTDLCFSSLYLNYAYILLCQ